MKMLVAVIVLLGVADVSLAVAIDGDCTSAQCDADLVCVSNKCKAKIGGGGCGTDSAKCVAGTCPSGTCICDAATEVAKSDNLKCLVKVGQSCSDANAVCAPGSTCPDAGTKTCGCDSGKTAKADNSACLKKIEEPCTAPADCISNTCTDKKCACPAKKLALHDLTDCRKIVGETCANAAECGMNAECPSTNKCTCKANFFPKDGQICGKKVGTTCANDSECVFKATCTGSPKKCACVDKYVKDSDDFCKASAAATVGSVLLMLGAVLTSGLL